MQSILVNLQAAIGFLLIATAATVPRELPAADEATERSDSAIRRVPWVTSRVVGAPTPPAPYQTRQVWSKLSLFEPVEMVSMPGTSRLVVVQLDGKVYHFGDELESSDQQLLLDLGALPAFWRAFGIAFHPDFGTNRYVYLCYAREERADQGTCVSRFEVSREPPWTVDPGSEHVVLRWPSGGHNGGCLRFGPDGYLYIATGDGSAPSPPDSQDTGQDISDLLSSILRIDVDHSSSDRAYAIPPDNPFQSVEGARGEVWAYGLRNPWKMAFDASTGDLWAGDVGWEMWEMVHRIDRGGNYGWCLVEGPQRVRPEAEPGPTPVIPPVFSHSHIESRSITGGHIYRGSQLPDLIGAYIYGDYVTGKIWALRVGDDDAVSVEELVDSSLRVIAFGEDRRHEIYIVAYDGTIHELVRSDQRDANPDFPRLLSTTGLYTSVKDRTPVAGVIPYEINAEPWEDGARAERVLAVPGTDRLEVNELQDVQAGIIKGAWMYPSGTVFAKTLSLPVAEDGKVSWRPVETQLLHRDGDEWRAYAYAWNDDASDATIVPPEGASQVFEVRHPDFDTGVRRQTWRTAARTECLVCHTTRAGSIHGFNPAQLRLASHAHTQHSEQLQHLAAIGLISAPSTFVDTMPSPWDELADLQKRGKAYLHVNCAHCHRRGGGGTAKFELRYELSIEEMLLVGERPSQGTFGIPFAAVVSPGDPFRSVLLYRMAKLGRGRMPHAGSGMVDARGLRLMKDWIQDLPESEPPKDAVTSASKRQNALVADLLKSPDMARTQDAVSGLLDDTSGALRLALAVDDGRLGREVRDFAIEAGGSHSSAQIRDLFERFLPESRRVQRLGAVVQAEELLSIPGDRQRGKELFLRAEGVQCRVCHRLGETGGQLGPDLSRIGRKLNRPQILESILEPSKAIEPRYVSYLVETVRGQIYSGLLASRSETEVVLHDAGKDPMRIRADDIETITPLQKSLMPELLLREMTRQQVADLISFLASLK